MTNQNFAHRVEVVRYDSRWADTFVGEKAVLDKFVEQTLTLAIARF